MARPKGEKLSDRANFLDLFESGNFADAEVRCGDKIWKVHRSIVCARSIWMEKAFAGGFKEAKTGVVSIEDNDPHMVGLALKHIYSPEGLTLEPEVKQTLFNFLCLAKLAKTADYLALDSLRVKVEALTARKCDFCLRKLCTRPGGEDSDNEPVNCAGKFLALSHAIEIADNWNLEILRKILLEFVWVGRSSFMDTKSLFLADLTKRCPQATQDLLTTYASTAWREDAVWAPKPDKMVCRTSHTGLTCPKCRRVITRLTKHQVYCPFTLDANNMPTREWCVTCSQGAVDPWRET